MDNAAIGGVAMLLGPCALKSLCSSKKIQPRMECAIFKSNPYAINISCYSPTNASDETDTITFDNELSSLVRHITKLNNLIIGRDMNAHIDKDGIINSVDTICRTKMVNISFLPKTGLYVWTQNFKIGMETMDLHFTNNSKVLINYISINKKCINNVSNCEAYSFKGVYSNHRIVSSQQGFAWIYAEIRNKQVKSHDMTYSHLPIVI